MNNQYFNNWRGHQIEIVKAGDKIQYHGYPVEITDQGSIACNGKIYMTQKTYVTILKNMSGSASIIPEPEKIEITGSAIK